MRVAIYRNGRYRLTYFQRDPHTSGIPIIRASTPRPEPLTSDSLDAHRAAFLAEDKGRELFNANQT